MSYADFIARLHTATAEDLTRIYDLSGSTLGHTKKFKTIAGVVFKPELAEVEQAQKQAAIAEEMYSNITVACVMKNEGGLVSSQGT
jgi:hypothetical protein